MFQIIKKAEKKVNAYCLGDSHPVLSRLMDEGKIVSLGNGDYEIFSEEVLAGGSGKGEIAHAGDYVKLSTTGFPYPNRRNYFLENHRLVAEDEYVQIPKLLYAWDLGEPMCEEIEFLMRQKGLKINEDDPKKCFSAFLWGTEEAAPRDAVIVFYFIVRDGAGQIADAEFNFIIRGEFEQFYDKILPTSSVT